eukprot:2029820-Rhodomonas_salina.1
MQTQIYRYRYRDRYRHRYTQTQTQTQTQIYTDTDTDTQIQTQTPQTPKPQPPNTTRTHKQSSALRCACVWREQQGEGGNASGRVVHGAQVPQAAAAEIQEAWHGLHHEGAGSRVLSLVCWCCGGFEEEEGEGDGGGRRVLRCMCAEEEEGLRRGMRELRWEGDGKRRKSRRMRRGSD